MTGRRPQGSGSDPEEVLSRRLELLQADLSWHHDQLVLARTRSTGPEAAQTLATRAYRKVRARLRPSGPQAPPGPAPAPGVDVRPRPGLLRRQRPGGDGPSAAFCVAEADLRGGTGKLDAALALADALHDAGWRTIVHLDRESANVAHGTDLVVVASPRTDLRRLPGRARLVALVQDDPAGWVAREDCGDFDAWLTTDERLTARLHWRGLEAVTVDPASPAAVRAVDSVLAAPPDENTWLGFFPDWRAGNPYLEMLYSRADRHGVVAVPVANPAIVPPTSFAGDRDVRRVLHIHWSNAVAQSAPTEDEAWSRAASFADGVDAFQASGGILVWTVHNVLPHDLSYPGPESAVLDTLARRADVIHVMGDATLEAVRPHYTLDPDRTLLVPHPSYVGWYPDSVSRAYARRALGLEPQVPVVLLQGQIREYKGVGRLLDALEDPRVAAAGVMAVVAGAPGQTAGVPALMRACEAHPRVISRFEQVPPEQMQLLYKAADATVLPYKRTLNSGALMASLGFGTPVIAPRTGCLPEMVDEDCALLFDPDDPSGLSDALAGMDRLCGPQARSAARRRAEAVLPADVSDAFLTGLRERIEGLHLDAAAAVPSPVVPGAPDMGD